jgi:hypothetical protein
VHHEWNRAHWDNHGMPARAPLPTYQRNYSGNRYPVDEHRQAEVHAQNYHYQSQHGQHEVQRAEARHENQDKHENHENRDREHNNR